MTLPDVARITFPADSLQDGTLVRIRQIPTPASPEFVEASTFLSARNIHPQAVQINVAQRQPAKAVNVILNIPTEYSQGRPAGQTPRVLALVENSNGIEVGYPTYEILKVKFDDSISSTTISIDLEPIYFSQTEGSDQIARLVLALGPGISSRP